MPAGVVIQVIQHHIEQATQWHTFSEFVLGFSFVKLRENSKCFVWFCTKFMAVNELRLHFLDWSGMVNILSKMEMSYPDVYVHRGTNEFLLDSLPQPGLIDILAHKWLFEVTCTKASTSRTFSERCFMLRLCNFVLTCTNQRDSLSDTNVFFCATLHWHARRKVIRTFSERSFMSSFVLFFLCVQLEKRRLRQLPNAHVHRRASELHGGPLPRHVELGLLCVAQRVQEILHVVVVLRWCWRAKDEWLARTTCLTNDNQEAVLMFLISVAMSTVLSDLAFFYKRPFL